MEREDTITNGEFNVKIVERSIVKPIELLPELHILPLSNLDLLSGRFPVTYFYVYCKPRIDDQDFTFVVEALKSSLASSLSYYYPFAGTIISNPKTGEPEILCNNNGALFFEAYANIPLLKLDLYDLNQSLQGKLVHEGDQQYPLHVQVTNYTCGGISITFTFDHALGDASTFANFLRSWSETAQSKPISCIPDHHRRRFKPRSPPTYHPSLDQTFISCKMGEIINMPSNDIMLKLLYHVDETHINKLQSLCSAGGAKRTKIEALSAYIWKLMATTIRAPMTRYCKMGWLVDGRRRMSSEANSMSNYIGNVLSVAVGEAAVEDLKQGSLSNVAGMVHAAIEGVANEAHFLDLIDWVECHRPGLMLAQIVLGRAGPGLVLSSAGQFPVAELDFGFGPPILGTTFTSIKRIGTAYMNQRPSARGDGSWVVSTFLWPELAQALESDPNHVFQPMTPNHLGL